MIMSTTEAPAVPGRSRAYLHTLLMLLVPAALFDSYDSELRALLLHQIQHSFHVSVAALGIVNIPIQAGQFVAFFLVRRADRVGRRPILMWSIAGYGLFTTLTALSFNLWSYAALQFAAQVFIGAEFGVAVTLLAEEYPAEERGRAMGILLLFSPVGAIVGGILLAVGLLHTPLGWRAFYLVSFIPLVIVSLGRRRLKESQVFLDARAARLAEGAQRARARVGSLRARARSARGRVGELGTSFLGIWLSDQRRRLIAVGMIALLQGLPATAAIGWWTYYAEQQRHLADGLAGTFFAVAAALSVGGYYACGKLMDRIGRRPTAVCYVVGAVSFGIAAFQVHSHVLMLVFLVGTAFFGVGVAPVLSAFAVELFPTAVRAQASAWIRNGFGNTGSLLGPALVGILGDRSGLIGNVGDAVCVLTLLALPIIFIVWRFVPETKDLSLDDRSTGG
jgi:MFS family permease